MTPAGNPPPLPCIYSFAVEVLGPVCDVMAPDGRLLQRLLCENLVSNLSGKTIARCIVPTGHHVAIPCSADGNAYICSISEDNYIDTRGPVLAQIADVEAQRALVEQSRNSMQLELNDISASIAVLGQKIADLLEVKYILEQLSSMLRDEAPLILIAVSLAIIYRRDVPNHWYALGTAFLLMVSLP